MQSPLSALLKATGKILARLSETIPTGSLRVSLKIDYILAFWLARDVSELRPDRAIFTRSWQRRCEQSFQHAIATQLHGPFAPLLSLAFSSRAEHYNLFLSSDTYLLAAVIDTELYIDQWLSNYPS